MLKATIDQLPSIIQNAKSEMESLSPSDATACSASYLQRCADFGKSWSHAKGDTLAWWYAPCQALGNRTPKLATDEGDLDAVITQWERWQGYLQNSQDR
jgi:hypothetical protein